MKRNVRAGISCKELDLEDYVPTPRKQLEDPNKAEDKATIVDFTALLSTDDSDATFHQLSAFMIDLFRNKQDPYVFYSLCTYAAQKYIPMDVFINAVKSDCDFVEILKIASLSEIDDCYEKHLPYLGRRTTIKNRDEVWQFIALGLMSFSKSPDYNNTENYLKNEASKLHVKSNTDTAAFLLTKPLFLSLSRQASPKQVRCNSRVLIVKWVVDVKKYRKYLDEVCRQWKGAQMTHILLIKEEIWEKREKAVQEIKEKHGDMLAVIREIEIFESVVMQHAQYKYFNYMKLIQTKNIFRGAARNDLPILMHVAVELAKNTGNPSLQNFVLPNLKPGIGVIKDCLLHVARTCNVEQGAAARSAKPTQVKKTQVRVESMPTSARQQQRERLHEGAGNRKKK